MVAGANSVSPGFGIVEWVAEGGTTTIAIRDTDAHFCDALPIALIGRLVFQPVNGLNQSVVITAQGSCDEASPTNWTDFPNPLTVTSSSNDLAALSEPVKYVRLKAQCSVGPGSGTLSVRWSGRPVEA